jgi:hypothetical protein
MGKRAVMRIAIDDWSIRGVDRGGPVFRADGAPASFLHLRVIEAESYQKCRLFQICDKLRIVKRTHWLPWLVGAGFLGLYGFTAAPSIVELFDDTLELQLVGPTFGLAHPTGYPLYVILSGLWSRLLLPIGNWAWRMNLFSALAAAITVGLVTVTARRLTSDLTPRLAWAPPLAAALVFGLGPLWWRQATVAEVYALHGLFVAALLALLVRAIEAPTNEIAHSTRLVTLSCLTFGLALAHHRTSLLLAPVLLLGLFWAAPGVWQPQRTWLLWGAALLTPLLLYLFIPVRAGMGVQDLHGSYLNTWSGFWDHILARQYTGFFSENPLAVTRDASDWFALWNAQTGLVGLALGLVGFAQVLTPRQRLRKVWLLVSFVLATNLIFALIYRAPDAEVFLLPALLSFALFAAGGLATLLSWLERWPRLAFLTAVIVLVLLVLGVGGRGESVNRRHDWAVHDYAVALAKVDFPPQSRVLALEGEATALRYLQAAEGLGRNATPIVADDPAQRRVLLADFVSQERPVYLTRELEGIGGQYSFTGEGPLVRVWPRGAAQTADPTHPADALLANGQLRLEGYDLLWLDQAGGPALRLALYWRPIAPLTQTLKSSLRLQSPDGTPWLWPDGARVQRDDYPLRLVAKTPDWLPNERICDVYDLPIPPSMHGQPGIMRVILYDEATLVEAGAWSAPVP